MQQFKYILKYQKRKTLALFLQEGNIVIKAPHGYPQEKIEAFIQEKSSWIEQKQKEFLINSAEFIDVLQLKKILYRGRQYDVLFATAKTQMKNGIFYIKNFKSMQRFFIGQSFQTIEQFLHQIAKKMQVHVTSVKLVNFKAKWGSCDRQKNIKLNWRIAMLPDEIIYYLLVHELAHTIEFNHAPSFWKVVERYCKNYKILRKMLKKYDFLANLYR